MNATSLADTQNFARALAAVAQPGDVIALSGEVGAGKTTFAQAFIASLLRKPESITSPTFTLMQHYETNAGFALLHADLYRLKHAEELAELGLEEYFQTHVSLIEWPEIAAAILPADALHITLVYENEDSRRITVYSEGARWQTLLEQCRA